MGGSVRIVLYAADRESADAAAQAAFAEVASVNAAMSDYLPDSEVSLLNRHAGLGKRGVSEPLFEVLRASQRFAALSGGAFDITVGPVVRLWRTARKEGRLPDEEARRAALRLVGFRLLTLDPEERAARLERAGMALDLGGIAKGYACDRACAELARRGIGRALVDAGGDMAMGDPPPGREAWRVRMSGDPGRVLRLARCGVATSGDTERYVEVGGRRYSHIVDPRTGMGLQRMHLVTVVGVDAMTADALATAVSVLGPEEGIALAEGLRDVEASMRWTEGEGTRTAHTGGLEALLERE